MTTHIVASPSEFTPEQLMHTVLEAAHVLHVSRSTIYVLMNTGSLRPVHIGRSIRISRAELERYIATLEPRERHLPVDNPESPLPAA